MSWRSWTATNPCPVCRGHRWSGASAEQCCGGYNPDLSETRVWCCLEGSGKLSSSGKSWECHLDEPYPWVEEPERSPSEHFSASASRLPRDLDREGGWREVARWRYVDDEGDGEFVRFEVLRFEHEDGRKTYRPGYPEGKRGHRWGCPLWTRVPYELLRLRDAIARGLRIYLVEGEKSADAINRLDPEAKEFTATTLPNGSNCWAGMPDAHKFFDGARGIILVIDRDQAGRNWARDAVAALSKLSRVPQLRLVQSRTTSAGDDVVDHLAADHSLQELENFS